jgi:AcrR family transcriptional regulator
MQHGYAATSTLEIATRARVSKRELYALVGNKQEMLVACITDRARRFQVPPELPVPRDRQTLEQVLTGFGEHLVREISDPAVIGVFRLAIAEAVHAPEVARALDSIGREASRAALRHIMAQAEVAGLLEGHPSELAQQFNALLLSDLMMSLLLGVVERPSPRATRERTRAAVRVFLQLHPAPRV